MIHDDTRHVGWCWIIIYYIPLLIIDLPTRSEGPRLTLFLQQQPLSCWIDLISGRFIRTVGLVLSVNSYNWSNMVQCWPVSVATFYSVSLIGHYRTIFEASSGLDITAGPFHPLWFPYVLIFSFNKPCIWCNLAKKGRSLFAIISIYYHICPLICNPYRCS